MWSPLIYFIHLPWRIQCRPLNENFTVFLWFPFESIGSNVFALSQDKEKHFIRSMQMVNIYLLFSFLSKLLLRFEPSKIVERAARLIYQIHQFLNTFSARSMIDERMHRCLLCCSLSCIPFSSFGLYGLQKQEKKYTLSKQNNNNSLRNKI